MALQASARSVEGDRAFAKSEAEPERAAEFSEIGLRRQDVRPRCSRRTGSADAHRKCTHIVQARVGKLLRLHIDGSFAHGRGDGCIGRVLRLELSAGSLSLSTFTSSAHAEISALRSALQGSWRIMGGAAGAAGGVLLGGQQGRVSCG